MNYWELVNSYIEKSGLTLAEIARRIKSKGVKADRTYLSKLKSGDARYPASEDVNAALAEVTGGDDDKLTVAAFIEKAPDSIKHQLHQIDNINIFLENLIIMIESVYPAYKFPRVPDGKGNDLPLSDVISMLSMEDKLFFTEDLLNMPNEIRNLIPDKMLEEQEVSIPTNTRIKESLSRYTIRKGKHVVDLSSEDAKIHNRILVDGLELTDEELKKLVAQIRFDRQYNEQ